MDFKECTDEEVLKYKQEYNLELSWQMATDVLEVAINRKIVGLIECSKGMYDEEDCIQIENFEVFEKGKGHGSEIIKKVLKELQGKVIYLYVHSEKSKAFWEKLNFIAVDDGTGTPIHRYSVV